MPSGKKGKMPTPKITVVIPSLNTAKYIRKCIESVRNQTLKEIEIIVVDAFSTDGTREIIEEYKNADIRIRLLDDTEKSTGFAKNLGILNASAPYYAIVEPDDYLPTDAFEKLYKVAIETGADIVKGNYCSFIENGGTTWYFPKSTAATPSDYGKMINPQKYQYSFLWVKNEWLGLYRIDFLRKHNILHNESRGASFQDVGFWFLTFSYASKVILINDTVYYYRKDNPYASMKKADKVMDTFREYQYIYSELAEEEGLFQKLAKIYYCCFFKDGLSVLKRISPELRPKLVMAMYDVMRKAFSSGYIEEGLFGADFNIVNTFLCSPKALINSVDEIEEKQKENLRRLIEELKGKKIIVFGAGSYGANLAYLLQKNGCNVLCFSDNNESKWGSSLNNIKIIAPSYCFKNFKDGKYIIAHKTKSEDIKHGLALQGIQEANILVCQLEDIVREIL